MFELEETIKVDDVITSFILKAYLLDRNERQWNYFQARTLYEVAVTIYEQLLWSLNYKLIISFYASETPVDCTECDHEYGCCKERKLMLAMVEKILEWLKEHKDDLQDIDYAEDVDLFFHMKS